MTKREAVKAYLRVARELDRLHGAAANYISRRDNNWQFEVSFKLRHVADRILKEYDVGDYVGGGPTIGKGERR